MFTRNISTLDRNLRVAVGLSLDMWFFSGWIDGPLAWAVGMACVYLLASASARHCPAYAVLGMPAQVLPPKANHGW